MSTFIALLRGVNLGGATTLRMEDLRKICAKLGCANVRTYIASGNVLFESTKSERRLKAELEAALEKLSKRRIGVLVRAAAELGEVLAANPFPNAPPAKTVVIFLDDKPPANSLSQITGAAGEEVRLGKREIYVHYVNGIGRSKLKIPAGEGGTARNMNTVARLVALAKNQPDGRKAARSRARS